MDRTRAYYLALGYDNPYEWAHFETVPFVRLKRPLADAQVAIVTTAAPFKPDAGEQGPGAPYNAAAKFYQVYDGPTDTMPDLRISHVAIDRAHTRADDIGAYFPLAALKRAADARQIKSVSPRFFGFPTNRSQKTNIEVDAPALVSRLKSIDTDAAILVPNCPVCHQSVSLAARALEASEIPTVILGSARDIVEHAGVPRFVFSDFPLGNAAGLPGDVASQDRTLQMALELLVTAQAPRTTYLSPIEWPGPSDWRLDYSNPERMSAEERARRRAEFDKGKAVAKTLR